MFIKYQKTPNFRDFTIAMNKINGGDFLSSTEVEITGTVKVHGTNAGVLFHRDGSVSYQSRNREVSVGNDNQGFASFMEAIEFSVIREDFRDLLSDDEDGVAIYGEFCGGNIQQGVSISGMEKAYIIFSVKAFRGEEVVRDLPFNMVNKSGRIYFINEFKTFHETIDMSKGEEAVELLSKLTLQVEDNCPVGASLNAGSNNTVGEGIVWSGSFKGNPFIFKTKGVKHQRSEKKMKIKAPKQLSSEQAEAVRVFIEKALTEDRLLQGIEYLKEMGLPIDSKGTGNYIKWVCQDVSSECQALVEESGLPWKTLSKYVVQTSRKYFLES